jgi:choline dehydrogenase-like flavoprotein
MAAVDEPLRVHGVARPRVIDASIMPTPVASGTNAAMIMIAGRRPPTRSSRAGSRSEPAERLT